MTLHKIIFAHFAYFIIEYCHVKFQVITVKGSAVMEGGGAIPPPARAMRVARAVRARGQQDLKIRYCLQNLSH